MLTASLLQPECMVKSADQHRSVPLRLTQLAATCAGASVNGQQHKPPSLEDQSYSGGEADAEQESSGSAGQRASLHRRSVSNSEVVDEQAWRSQDPGKRLQQLRTGKAAASRSATISPRNTFSVCLRMRPGPGCMLFCTASGRLKLTLTGICGRCRPAASPLPHADMFCHA